MYFLIFLKHYFCPNSYIIITSPTLLMNDFLIFHKIIALATFNSSTNLFIHLGDSCRALFIFDCLKLCFQNLVFSVNPNHKVANNFKKKILLSWKILHNFLVSSY